MRTLATITLALVVIVASLVLASSSMCAVSGLDTGAREMSAVIALVALAVIIAGVMGILRLRREPGGE